MEEDEEEYESETDEIELIPAATSKKHESPQKE